jgi:putative membrane protein
MFAQIIIAIILGIFSGIVTGLIPGVHINLISATLLSISPLLLVYTNSFILVVFIISMSVTHTFLDTIPSIFLGAPDSSQVLGVLPGHRYLLKGKGLLAVKLTVIGSYGAVILSILFFPIFVLFVKYVYHHISSYVKYFIVIVIIFMILKDKKKVWAIIVFLISGVLGVLVLSSVTIKNPLFPMLSGMFGVSTLLYSLKDNNTLPKQKNSVNIPVKIKLFFKSIFSGCFSGFLTAITPALGAGMASAISATFTKGLGDKGFMILIGSISTFNFVLSLVTYYTLDKARNGSIIAVQELLESLSLNYLIIILLTVLIVGSISVLLSLVLSKFFLSIVFKINYKKLTLSIILLIFFMALILSNYIGILILIVSTAIGLIPAIKKITRTMAMGCLMLPVLLFLFGVM